MDSAKSNQRDIIFFLWKEGATGSDIARRLHNVFGEDALRICAVNKWIRRFKVGWTVTSDAPKSGRPRTSVTPDNINRVKEILEQDRRVSVMDISEALGISTGSVHHILVEELQLS